jgi:hypothetical protein
METKKPPRHKAQESETIKRRAHGKRLFEDFSPLLFARPQKANAALIIPATFSDNLRLWPRCFCPHK